MEQQSLKTYRALPPTDENAIDPNSSYAALLKHIGRQLRVADIGCGPGNLARFLAQRGCTVTGVDINAESAGIAKEYCDNVIVADLDTASLVTLFPSERFDVVIFADILEHVRDPQRVLAESLHILRAGGYVLASIPNIAHGAVRLHLLDGEFDYQNEGILDDAHVRFFTLKTIDHLFENAGLLIENITRTKAPIFGENALLPRIRRDNFPPEVVRIIQEDAEAETLQFIIKAVPITSSKARYISLLNDNRLLQARVTELQDALTDLECDQKIDIEAARMEAEQHLATLNEEYTRANEQWVAYREMLETALAEQQTRAAAAEAHVAELKEGLTAAENASISLELRVAEMDRARDTWRQQRKAFERALASARAGEVSLRTERDRLQSELAAVVEEYTKKATSAQSETSRLLAELRVAQMQAASLGEAAAKAKELFEQVEQLRAQNSVLAAMRDAVASQLHTVVQRLNERECEYLRVSESKATIAAKADALTQQLADAQSRAAKIEAQLAATQNAYTESLKQSSIEREARATLDQTLSLTTQRLRDVSEELAQTRTQCESLESDVASLREIELQARIATGRFEAAETLYDATKLQVQRLSVQLEQLRASYAEIEAERDTARTELRIVSEHLGERSSAAEELERELNDLREAYANALSLIDRYEARSSDADRHYANAVAALERSRACERASQQRCAELERRITGMRQSKFWIIRDKWFAIKHRLGFPQSDL